MYVKVSLHFDCTKRKTQQQQPILASIVMRLMVCITSKVLRVFKWAPRVYHHGNKNMIHYTYLIAGMGINLGTLICVFSNGKVLDFE